MTIRTHKMITNAGDINSAFTAGSILPANSAGPSAKHFYPANEGSGTTLTDIIGGANLVTATNAWTALYHDGNDSAEAVAAAFNDFGTTGDIVYFNVLGADQTNLVATGAGGGIAGELEIKVAYGIFATGISFIIDDDVTKLEEIISYTSTIGDILGLGIVINRTSGITNVFAYDGVNFYRSTIDTSALATFQPAQKMTSSGLNYGIGLWHFADGAPADYETAFVEMYDNWKAGKKILPSTWIDK